MTSDLHSLSSISRKSSINSALIEEANTLFGVKQEYIKHSQHIKLLQSGV